jgi:hypothetical protein
MKAILLLLILALAGCAEDQSVTRWNDMWTDIKIRHQYEYYLKHQRPDCGYSKE